MEMCLLLLWIVIFEPPLQLEPVFGINGVIITGLVVQQTKHKIKLKK